MPPLSPVRADWQHRQLVAWTIAHAQARGHVVAAGTSTLTGKRPDVASIDPHGHVVVWEVKTRFKPNERREAFAKYATSCDLLILVYPHTTSILGWSDLTWRRPDPSAARCGALVLSEHSARHLILPATLAPNAEHRRRLMVAIALNAGLPPPNISAVAQS